MFSDTALRRRTETAAKLGSISKEEKAEVADYLEYINKSAANRENFSSVMVDKGHDCYLPRDKLFRFYLNHEEFKRFLDNDDLPHAIYWSIELEKAGYIPFRIQSVDKQEELSVARLFIIAHLNTLVRNEDNPKDERQYWLDKACDLGSFSMLLRRCNENADILKASAFSDTEAVGHFFNDVRHLGNLYGTFGYATAMQCLWDVGLGLEAFLNDPKSSFAKAAYLMGADYFSRAKILFIDTKNTLNQNILHHATDGEGLKHFVSNPESIFYIPQHEFAQKSPDEIHLMILQKYEKILAEKLTPQEIEQQYTNALSHMYKPEAEFNL